MKINKIKLFKKTHRDTINCLAASKLYWCTKVFSENKNNPYPEIYKNLKSFNLNRQSFFQERRYSASSLRAEKKSKMKTHGPATYCWTRSQALVQNQKFLRGPSSCFIVLFSPAIRLKVESSDNRGQSYG